MRNSTLFEILEEALGYKPTQTLIASILGIKQGVIGNRAVRNSKYSDDEIEKIESYFGIRFVRGMGGNYTAFRTCEDENSKIEAHRLVEQFINNIENKKNTSACPSCGGQIDIPYLECLPEEAKLAEITSVHTDLEIIENHWQRDPEKLRIIPMQGDCLVTYTYPCRNRDILIIDTGSVIPTREGLYCYSAMNNSLIYVAKLSQSIDGTIKIEKFNANGEVVVKPVTLEKQKEVDFRVLGRVIKNVSLAL